MFRRLNLFFLLVSYAVSGMTGTNTSNWDCTQTIDNAEWLCITEPRTDAEETVQDTKQVPVTAKFTQAASRLPAFNYGPYVAAADASSATPPRTIDRSGWDCKVEDDVDKTDRDLKNNTWACHLNGPNPKGLASIVTTDGARKGFGFSAFDIYEEQIFKRMQVDFDVNPWENCRSPYKREELLFEPDMVLREQVPLDVKADYSEIFDKEITIFTGNVNMTRADQIIKVDRATYDSVSQAMDAQGNLYYRETGLSLFADTALLRLADDQARMRNALFILPAGRSRGSAKVVYRDSATLSRYKDIVYTSCKPGNQDWVLHASRLKINRESGKASAKQVRVDFYGVPLFYTPYLILPIDDRRTSGFLSPSFSHNDENGYDFTLPYYWNIAPNYDATFRPRTLSKRGLLLAGDFRYLTKYSKGEIKAEYLPYDDETKKTRGRFSWQNKTTFFPGLKSNIDLGYISDDDYQDDLGSTLSNFNNRHVRSHAKLSYRMTGLHFKTLFENYQTIDRSITSGGRPYRRIPQITLDLAKKLEIAEVPFKFELENAFVYFHRSDDNSSSIPRTNVVTGQRLIVEPSVSIPYFGAAGFIKPRIALHHTQYWLQNSEPALNLSANESHDRTLPIFTVDAGLFLARDVALFGSTYQQTLEPRIFYRYVPFDDQSDLPDFDTSEFDFSFNQLFRGERFNGGDRVGDANQVSLGFTSRLYDAENGQERLKINLGQLYYFRDREVTLPGQTVATGNYSNLILGVSGQLTDTLFYSSLAQWNPDISELERGEGFMRYRGKQQQLFNVGFRYRKENLFQGAEVTKQTEISALWPLFGEWSLFGRWLYSFDEGLTPDAFFGVQKESCCWRFRILGRREIRNVNRDPNSSIFFQLELKGLAGFGKKVEKFLKRNISGYQSPRF